MRKTNEEWGRNRTRIELLNPVKKNMDKFHKPKTHRDRTKYNRKRKVSNDDEET